MTEQVLHLIEKRNKDNPIQSKVIEKTLFLAGSEIRGIIHELRLSGHPIASDSNGYYMAESIEELDHTIAQLKSRGNKIFEVARKLENCFNEQPQLQLFQG